MGEQFGGQVERRDARAGPRRRDRDYAGSGADIEHRFARPDPRNLHQMPRATGVVNIAVGANDTHISR